MMLLMWWWFGGSTFAQVERVQRYRPVPQPTQRAQQLQVRPVPAQARPVYAPRPSQPLTTAPAIPPQTSAQPVNLSSLNASPPVPVATTSASHGGPPIHGAGVPPIWKAYFDFWLYSRPGINLLTFDNIHGMLLFEIVPTPQLQFNVDLGMTGANAIPRFYELAYQATPRLQIRVGRILIPFDDMVPHNIFGGRINVSKLSPPGSTDQFLPDIWSELGVALKYQLVDSMAFSMAAHAYVVNGFGGGGINPEPSGSGGTEYPVFRSPQTTDNNVDKALGGRVQMTFARRLSIGGSVYSGQWSDADSGTPRRVLMYGGDGQLRLGALEIRAGWAGMTVGLTDTSFLRGGMYGELGLKFGYAQRWKILGRGGLVQLDNRVIAVSDQTIVGGALLYRPGMVQLSGECSVDLNRSVAKSNTLFAALRVAVEL